MGGKTSFGVEVVLSVLMKARHMTSPELKKRPLFSSKRGQTRPLCRAEMISLHRNSFLCQRGPLDYSETRFSTKKGRASTPRDGSRPPRAPGNEAIAMRGRTILITTRASVKRASRPHSSATRSNKSTKGDRQKSEPDAMPDPPLAAPRVQRACPPPYRVT